MADQKHNVYVNKYCQSSKLTFRNSVAMVSEKILATILSKQVTNLMTSEPEQALVY